MASVFQDLSVPVRERDCQIGNNNGAALDTAISIETSFCTLLILFTLIFFIKKTNHGFQFTCTSTPVHKNLGGR